MVDHPAVAHHKKAAEEFRKAAEHHDDAAAAHELGDHKEGKEHADKAKQAGLEAALHSETAATSSKGTT